MPCIFCEIVAGRVPANIVLQDDRVTAFRDIDPRAPTHLLIVPNRHIQSLAEASGEDFEYAAACLGAARELAAKHGLTNGYRVVTNVGREGGQSVSHLHFHLLAGRKMTWPPG